MSISKAQVDSMSHQIMITSPIIAKASLQRFANAYRSSSSLLRNSAVKEGSILSHSRKWDHNNSNRGQNGHVFKAAREILHRNPEKRKRRTRRACSNEIFPKALRKVTACRDEGRKVRRLSAGVSSASLFITVKFRLSRFGKLVKRRSGNDGKEKSTRRKPG